MAFYRSHSEDVLKISRNYEEMLAVESFKEKLQATGLKGYLHYFFARLFCMSKRKHL